MGIQLRTYLLIRLIMMELYEGRLTYQLSTQGTGWWRSCPATNCQTFHILEDFGTEQIEICSMLAIREATICVFVYLFVFVFVPVLVFVFVFVPVQCLCLCD